MGPVSSEEAPLAVVFSDGVLVKTAEGSASSLFISTSFCRQIVFGPLSNADGSQAVRLSLSSSYCHYPVY